MSVPKEKLKQLAIDYALLIGGGIVFALSLNLFLKPSQIVPGGFTGLTTLLNYLYQLPIGASMFILNVPLFLYSYKKLGKEFTIKTLVSTFSMSAAIDLLAFLPKVSRCV